MKCGNCGGELIYGCGTVLHSERLAQMVAAGGVMVIFDAHACGDGDPTHFGIPDDPEASRAMGLPIWELVP